METILIISSILLWFIVLFNLVITFALVKNRKATQQEVEFGLKPGTKAPSFSSITLSGATVTIDNYKNQQVAFLFVNPRCQTCKETIINYIKFHKDIEQAGARMNLVSLGNWEDTCKLAEEFKLDNSVIVAPVIDNPFANNYKCQATPSYCIIDGSSQIVLASGAPVWEDGGDLKLYLDRWLQKQGGLRSQTSLNEGR